MECRDSSQRVVTLENRRSLSQTVAYRRKRALPNQLRRDSLTALLQAPRQPLFGGEEHFSEYLSKNTFLGRYL